MNRDLAAQIAVVAEWPDTCDAGVYRQGEYEPCSKPAVGIILNTPDDALGAPAGTVAWPVCAHHARKDRMVPLRDLLAWHGRLARPSAASIYADITGSSE